MSLYSVDRNGVKVAEFYARKNTVYERMIEIVLRLKPTNEDKWDLWEEPRAAAQRTELKEYAVVQQNDENGKPYYTTYVGNRLFSTKHQQNSEADK